MYKRQVKGAATTVAVKVATRGKPVQDVQNKPPTPPSAPPGSLGAMSRLRYEPSPKHGTTAKPTASGTSSPAPKHGQEALDTSLQIKDTSPRRIGIDYETGDFIVFDRTSAGVFHGHVRPWSELTSAMKKTLIEADMTNKRGKILIGAEHNK